LIRNTTLARCIPLCALIAAGSVAGYSQQSAKAANSATVSVNVAAGLATISNAAYGVNTAVWDGNMLDSTVPGLLSQAGVTAMRFPGGSTSDTYHWQTNSITAGQGGYANPNNTFDAFMGVAQKAGAQPVITVNYGSNAAGNGGGDPTEAANWVRYANITKKYGVGYWEIGNEVYGNNTYSGWNWETDLHGSKGPATYAGNVVAYSTAMKAVDPSIQVGAVMLAPGSWPDGVAPDWDSTVLSTACSSIDFAIIHWYAQGPGSETDAGLLTSTSQIPNMVAGMRSKINQYCGSRASQIKILVTETNSVSSNPGKQSTSLVNALFLADDSSSWLEHGITSVDWWDLHNGINTGANNSSSLYGAYNYGDYGILSDGTSSGGVSEPAADTPFPSYYGLRMLNYLGKAGDQFVSATSTQSLIAVHAVKQANGNLALLIVNRDPANSYNVGVSVSGYSPNGTASVYSFGKGSTAITSTSAGGYGSSFTQSVAPYSLTTVVLQQGTPPTATATAVVPTATRTATPAAPTATATQAALTATPAIPTATHAAPTATPVVPTATATPGGTPAFSQVTTVSPATVSANATTTVHTVVTNTGGALSNGIVDLEVYNSSGSKVGQQYFSGQNLAHGASATYTYAWTAPATSGAYTVEIGVFGANWAPNYYWNGNAGTIIVIAAGPPVVSDSTTASPSAPVHGTSDTVHAVITVSSGALANGIVDMEVYNAAGVMVNQQYFSGQNISAGQSASFNATWIPPAAGQYTVRIGVFGPNWAPDYSWDGSAALIQVS
jgi:Glycosyl hydrolase family 79, N-terminal domain